MPTNTREPTLRVSREGQGESKSLEVPLNKLSFLGEGFAGSVHRVTLPPRREGLEPLHFAYKKLDHPRSEDINTAYFIHRKLLACPHGAQFTLPTFRFSDEGLFMTDLSEGGKNLVVSSNDRQDVILDEVKKITTESPNLLTNFLERENPIFDDEQWNAKFEEQAQLIATETGEAGIVLTGDSIFFTVYPDGTYRLFVVDLDSVSLQEGYTESLSQRNLRTIRDIKPFIIGLWLDLYRLENKEQA